MSIGYKILVGAALLVGQLATAQAGGMWVPPAGSMKDTGYQGIAVPGGVGMQETVSWYIRGDIGYLFHGDADVLEESNDYLGGVSFEESLVFGGGIGYYFSDHVRGDITLDFVENAKVSGENRNIANAIGIGPRYFDVQSLVTLANLYYDFDARSDLTPYVGVGLGFTVNKTSDGIASSVASGTGCSCEAPISSASNTDVAMAVMAGFTYSVRTGLHLDAGYRFMYLGDAHTGPITATNAMAGDPEVQDITTHDFRLGIRYDIW